MNTRLLAIVKRIVAEQGEGILADAARIKPFIKDYAKNEAKEERLAFGRCIEFGFYGRLKSAQTPGERRRVKAALAQQLQRASELDASLCAAALDVLDAAIPSAALQTTQSAAPALGWTPPRVSMRTLIFAIAAGAGALVGESISSAVRAQITFSHVLGTHIMEMSFWGGVLSVGISVALLAAQHILQSKPFNLKNLLRPVLLGILSGAVASGIAQAVFNVTSNISPVVKAVSNALCWGLFGAGLGFGVSLFIPNYPKQRAMLAGLLGGTLGGAIYVALLSSATNAGGTLGVIVLGFVIGLAISWVEEALREAWLTVIWGPKESRAIALGAKSIVFGSSREADVYLPTRRGDIPAPPIRAIVMIENGKVIMDDRATNQRRALQNGSEVDLGSLRFVVNAKFDKG